MTIGSGEISSLQKNKQKYTYWGNGKMIVNKWTASQIARKVIDNNELFILDVRNT